MNILFLTLLDFKSIQEPGIYTDLLREFVVNGHNVYAISPVEKRKQQKTHVIKEPNATILKLRIGNTQKTNIIEKGISTVLIEPAFKKSIKRYFSNIKFDMILYSTPPITLVSAVEYVKKRDGAKTYLLLKDIFPQNAVDIGLISRDGVKGLLYRHFRKQEKSLYAISDIIGCMSQANVDYVIDHNPEVDPSKVKICFNSIAVMDKSVDKITKSFIRKKYEIPLDKTVFVYGGNLGKPQDIPFIIDCLKACGNKECAYFLIVGDGTEYHLVQDYINNEGPINVKLMKILPKEDYDSMVGACDVGLIFLDHRFTIPNFPSRMLAYMQAKLPVLACTDSNTDVGEVITEGGFGWWCRSDDPSAFVKCVNEVLSHWDEHMGTRAFEYLNNNFHVKDSYLNILESIKKI